jgi:low temperature requirement protein LtrA
MNLSFRVVSIAASGVCFALAVLWMLVPQSILWAWRIDSPEPALIMARRGAALLLGIGALLFLARNVGPSPARHAIATGLATSCSTLAALGVFDFATKRAGLGIWLAITVEFALTIAFLSVRHKDAAS